MSDIYNTLLYNGEFAKVTSTGPLSNIRALFYGIVKGQEVRIDFSFGRKSNLYPLVTLFNLTSTNCL